MNTFKRESMHLKGRLYSDPVFYHSLQGQLQPSADPHPPPPARTLQKAAHLPSFEVLLACKLEVKSVPLLKVARITRIRCPALT